MGPFGDHIKLRVITCLSYRARVLVQYTRAHIAARIHIIYLSMFIYVLLKLVGMECKTVIKNSDRINATAVPQ